ncbi:MAG TPA: GAF domain-containing sensor histidine kinase [Fimbriimonadaceae bacterium]|mgnify:CR=1 FL=1|nr:GAF domain-containing sensor histidine kinase [Fimbriimonadaceae bacterium]
MQVQQHLLDAVQRATRTLAQSGNFDALLKDVLAICVEAVGASGGTIYLHDPVKNTLRFHHVLPESVANIIRLTDIPDDQGVAGAVFQNRQTRIDEFPEVKEDTADPRAQVQKATGVYVRNMITVPLMMENEPPIGVVQLVNKESGSFNKDDMTVLDTVSAVSTLAFLNSRLVEESSRASTLLGMGKVAHDIGNLAASLFANLSVGEHSLAALSEQITTDNALRDEVESLTEIQDQLRRSVDRIVRYSRLMSDLSANRALRPTMEFQPMGPVVKGSASYLESEARKNGVKIAYEIEEDAPHCQFDEFFVFRIVQNLVGNAIKAVRETLTDDQIRAADGEPLGVVTVRYRLGERQHVVEVGDTGPGMSEETARRILTGNSYSRWEKGGGSGWGTKIVLELATVHEAKCEIDSILGEGSVFRLRFPCHE